MSNEEEDRESTKRGMSGWRKVAVWVVGAALLAFVGHRSALGSAVADTPSPGATAVVATAYPAASSPSPGGEASPETSARVAAPRASSAPAGSEDAPVESGAPAPSPRATSTSEPARAPEPPAGSPGITADGKVILNVATEVDLRKLPGIGRARAQAILQQRERLGRFRRLEDLLRIKGIGRKRLVALRPKVVLDPP
jgi:competence protein ComEA